MELTLSLKQGMRLYYLHKPQNFTSTILTSQDLPDLPLLDADKIIRDVAKIIDGDPSMQN